MSEFLGLDTSTTSAAVYDDETGKIIQNKKFLPVKAGECGLRQSDAVFHHVSQLTEVASDIVRNTGKIKAVCVSSRPRNIEGS